MRITRLWISNYKNVRNLELKFNESYLITLLIGQNGLGKSNLIEILALIFRDLDLMDSEEELLNWAFDPAHFEYEIEYECHSNFLRINCYEGEFKVFVKHGNSFTELTINHFLRNKSSGYLPDYVIGYYSGENKRVRNIIKVHEKTQFDFLKSLQRRKRLPNEEKIRRLFFTESAHSQLVLLTLAIYQNVPEFSKPIKKLLLTILRIKSIENFSIKFNNPKWYRRGKRTDGIDNLISNIIFTIEPYQEEYPFWGLKGKIDQMLTDLYNIQLEAREPVTYVEEGRARKELIEFDNIDLVKFSEKAREHFPHPIDFFYALEGTSVIESLHSIKISVKKINGDGFDFEQLSEGEQQLLTVLGIILITGKDDCLFLLDEPDTHLNPKWQRDYVELLNKFDINGGRSNMIVATHSPLIVQSSKDSNIVLFSLKKNGQVRGDVSELQFHTWRLDQVLTSPFFGLESARPKDAKLDQFMRRRKEILAKAKMTKDDEKFLTSYVDDFDLLPTGETFTDLKAMSVVHSVAKQNDSNK